MPAHQNKKTFNFKTQYCIGFNPQEDEIVSDFFSGGSLAGWARRSR